MLGFEKVGGPSDMSGINQAGQIILFRVLDLMSGLSNGIYQVRSKPSLTKVKLYIYLKKKFRQTRIESLSDRMSGKFFSSFAKPAMLNGKWTSVKTVYFSRTVCIFTKSDKLHDSIIIPRRPFIHNTCTRKLFHKLHFKMSSWSTR